LDYLIEQKFNKQQREARKELFDNLRNIPQAEQIVIFGTAGNCCQTELKGINKCECG